MNKNFTTYRNVFSILKQYPLKLTGLIVFSFLGTLTEGLGLALILPILEGVHFENDLLASVPLLKDSLTIINNMTLTERVRLVAVFLVLILAVRSLFSAGAQILSSVLGIQTEGKLQRQVFLQVQSVQISYIHGEKQGNILEILSRHTSQTGVLIQEVINVIGALLAVLAYVGVMMWLSWQLTLLTLTLQLVISLFIRQRLAERIKQIAYKTRSLGMELQSIMVENLSAVKLIHFFGREGYSFARFRKVQEAYISNYFRSDVLLKLSIPLYNLLNGLVLGVLLIASTYILPGQTEAWLGEIILFIIIIFRLMIPAAKLNFSHSKVSQLEPALESVQEFLRTDDKPYLSDGQEPFTQLAESVVITDVTFRYNFDEASILENVSFELPKGKITAVVGASGAGKTTLVNLIARLYDPQVGQIFIDGTDLRNLIIESWRREIAIVSQDTFLFNDTVMGNLRFARPGATVEDVCLAARLAQAHDFIMKLPSGYDTILGDRGVRLSGGQQQRLAIARALLVDPKLLILDEATSDLDSETEQAIQSAIEKFSEKRTLFIIAHRLSTVKQADNIIVLSRGEIVEQGNHTDLMAMQSHYWRLVQAQDLSIDLDSNAISV
ncbi:ABC transporter ATP-binding protein [Chloroflexota bacterium]